MVIHTYSIIVAGVSGQGVGTTAKIIARAAMNSGYDVKMQPVGNFRAGGASAVMIKFGDRVYTADIGRGEANVLLAMEKLECARWIDHLMLSGAVFTSLTEIVPASVQRDGAPYPNEIFDNLAMLGIEAVVCDTETVCRMCENGNATGAVLLGIAGDMLCLSRESIRGAIKECLPEEAAKSTLKAYDIALSMNSDVR